MQATPYKVQSGARLPARIAMLVGAILAGAVLFGAMASNAGAKTQRGVFLTGEESGEAANQPRFNAESYTTYLSSSSELHRWEFGELGVLECPVSFTGKMTSAAPSMRLSPFVSYFACPESPKDLAVTINWNGCDDTLDLLNAGPPYVAEFGIDCPPERSYEFGLGGVCTVSLPDQSGLAQVDLETTGSGSSRAIDVDFEVTGLKYTITGFKFVCKNGTYENGTYTGSATLKGFDEP